MAILSFSNTVHWCLLHSTQSNWYSAKHPSIFLSFWAMVPKWSRA